MPIMSKLQGEELAILDEAGSMGILETELRAEKRSGLLKNGHVVAEAKSRLVLIT